MRVNGVLETCLCVDDLSAAENFYRDVLGLEIYSSHLHRHVFFRCGDGMLLLFDARATARDDVEINGVRLPLHGTHGPGHAAFRVSEDDLHAWRGHLQQHLVEIEAEVHWPNGGRSIYFRDPANNSLELATPQLWGLPDEK